MDFQNLQTYLMPAALVGFVVWRVLRFRGVRQQLPSLLAQGAVVVDVRSKDEFSSGARKGSLNIPLDTLEREVDRLDRKKPIVLCCASGTRSGMAVALLKRKGFKYVYNGGPWRNTVL
jgi:rhodanese-related sulfurtransferase